MFTAPIELERALTCQGSCNAVDQLSQPDSSVAAVVVRRSISADVGRYAGDEYVRGRLAPHGPLAPSIVLSQSLLFVRGPVVQAAPHAKERKRGCGKLGAAGVRASAVPPAVDRSVLPQDMSLNAPLQPPSESEDETIAHGIAGETVASDIRPAGVVAAVSTRPMCGVPLTTPSPSLLESICGSYELLLLLSSKLHRPLLAEQHCFQSACC